MIGVETFDGELITPHQLVKLVPGHIFHSKQHVETCIILASDNVGQPDDKTKVFINLLVKQSTLAKCITALKFLMQHNSLQCKTLYLPEILKEKLDDDFFACENRVYIKESVNLIDRLSAKNLLLKSIAHRVYRLIGWRSKRKIAKHTSLVRCYVEVSETLHKNEIMDSLCVFFPFPYKISRQVNFYKSCLRRNYDTAIYGVPYSIWRAFKLFFKKDDASIIDFEYEAYHHHAVELAKFNIKHYYTEDDYVPASFLVGKKLKEAGCRVVNRSHGVGYDCPYICAHSIDVLTKSQINYYKHWNDNTDLVFNFQKREVPNTAVLLSECEEVCYVFMHSNFKDHLLHYEGALQERILKALSNCAKVNQLDICIKYHPNTSIKEELDLPEISSINCIDKIKVFITINSASFYTYSQYGLFLFFGDELCNPFEIIDPKALFYHINDLDSVLLTYQNKAAITTALAAQSELLRSFN